MGFSLRLVDVIIAFSDGWESVELACSGSLSGPFQGIFIPFITGRIVRQNVSLKGSRTHLDREMEGRSTH